MQHASIASFDQQATPIVVNLDVAMRAPRNAPVGVARSVAKDETIFGQGDAATHYFRVVGGVVRTCTTLADGRRQIDGFHVAGDIFGLERGSEHRFSAEAVGDATVISFRRCDFGRLFDSGSADATNLVASAFDSLERAQRHTLLLGRRSAIEKVATFLIDMVDRVGGDAIDLPMSRIDIADYLGLTVETVSRSLTQLEREGTIELPIARRNILIRDDTALRDLCL